MILNIAKSDDFYCTSAWHGMGRKSAWWSPVLMALYDAETGTYQAVCKCISGFTDTEYKSMKFER
jgi:DNA ligase-1